MLPYGVSSSFGRFHFYLPFTDEETNSEKWLLEVTKNYSVSDKLDFTSQTKRPVPVSTLWFPLTCIEGVGETCYLDPTVMQFMQARHKHEKLTIETKCEQKVSKNVHLSAGYLVTYTLNLNNKHWANWEWGVGWGPAHPGEAPWRLRRSLPRRSRVGFARSGSSCSSCSLLEWEENKETWGHALEKVQPILNFGKFMKTWVLTI